MKLTMLGTGHALATECYNTCFAIEDKGKYFLVDGGGGNGILHQLNRAKIDCSQIDNIFVTHKHYDHILGILWLIRIFCQSMYFGGSSREINIFAHDEVIELLKQFSIKILPEKESQFINNCIHLIKVFDKEQLAINDRKILFFDIHSSKAKQFGFRLAIGDNEFLACCGDEPCDESNIELLYGCKWLMHEAFCLYSQADIFNPYQLNHSTVREAALLASRANIRNLLLYHTEDYNLENRKVLYSEEARKFFNGNIYVPDDLDEIVL